MMAALFGAEDVTGLAGRLFRIWYTMLAVATNETSSKAISFIVLMLAPAPVYRP